MFSIYSDSFSFIHRYLRFNAILFYNPKFFKLCLDFRNNGQEAEPLIEDAVKAYLNSAVDQDSKDIFKKFIEVFNGVSEYKDMVTECLSQKRDQVMKDLIIQTSMFGLIKTFNKAH